MSTTQPTPPTPTPPPPPPRSSGLLANQWVRYGLAFVLGLVIGGAAMSAADTTDGGGAATSPTASVDEGLGTEPPEVTESQVPSPSPEPDPAFTNITKQDVELSLKTTSRQCFGSAGCLVDVQVRLTLLMSDAEIEQLPPDGTWDITYRITGDESGPLIGTFSAYGNGKYDVNEESISTSSSNTPVEVHLVSVERF